MFSLLFVTAVLYLCTDNIEIYNEAFGGFVFYVDLIGQYGLVSELEDFEETYE